MKSLVIFFSAMLLLIIIFVVASSHILLPDEKGTSVLAMVNTLKEQSSSVELPIPKSGVTNTATTRPIIRASSTMTPFLPMTSTATPIEPTATQTPTPTPTPTPDPALWKDWPVMPVHVSDYLRQVYQVGLLNGNDPRAFSILGDCQSQPWVFMGIYDTDPAFVQQLDPGLQEAASNFHGSFNRYSPTVKDGSTEAALLWSLWNDNRAGLCEVGESPIDCELRVHNPVIAFVHIGTHWEARNEYYLSILIEKLLNNGTVPIIVTKADNREYDERVNGNLVKLAAQYDLPLWNFWASVQDLPNHGMLYNSNMYLSKAGLEVHRIDALKVLDYVWRELQKEE